jgi:hypothetical protein
LREGQNVDEVLAGALTVVELDSSSAQRWFDAIIRVRTELRASDSGDDWDAFRVALTTAAEGEFLGSELPQRFIEYSENNGRFDVVTRMEDYASNLPELWAQAVAEHDRAEPTEVAEVAEPATAPGADRWEVAVARFGSGWAGWDGTEASWPRFRDWFYTSVNALDPQVYTVAYQHLDPLNTANEADRIGRLLELGLTITAQPPAAARPAAPPDPWDQAVAAYGSGWAGWDGTEASWPRFRDWFYAATNALDPAVYAAVYARLQPLDGLAPADRIARLTESGLTVNAIAPAPAEKAEGDGATRDLPRPGTAEFAQEVVAPVAQAVENQVPQLAARFGMTEEEVRAELAALGPDFLERIAADELTSAAG